MNQNDPTPAEDRPAPFFLLLYWGSEGWIGEPAESYEAALKLNKYGRPWVIVRTEASSTLPY